MFPSDTELNPREQCNMISLRSGKNLSGPGKIEVVSEREKIREEEREKIRAEEREIIREEIMKEEKEKIIEEIRKEEKEKIKNEKELLSRSEKFNKVPFPVFSKDNAKKKLERQFSKFVSMFKKLNVDIPFSEVLEKMPQYAKFMKEILSKKRKLSDEDATVELTEEVSAIIQQKLPPKLKDPGSFTLPVEIGNIKVGRALCDLGASINLMPLTVYERLKIGNLKPTKMNLQLADRSIAYPYGVVEDVLVKVDKFIFPVNFVVSDVQEDSKVPLIFGRPFLATGNAEIDVAKGLMSLRVGEEKAIFKIFDLKVTPADNHDVFFLEMLREWSDTKLEQFFLKEGFSKKKKNEKATHLSKSVL